MQVALRGLQNIVGLTRHASSATLLQANRCVTPFALAPPRAALGQR
jgi:hypothetical protein